MASNNSELSIVVRLIDDASSALRSMAGSMSSSISETTASLEQLTKTGGTARQWQDAYSADATNFINQQEEATTATKEIDEATEHSGHTLSGMVKTMVEYTLAWQGVAAIEGVVTGFFKTAISQAMSADDTMAQLRVNVQNAGLSFEELAPQIDAVAQQNIALGFADDDTTESLGKLLLTTGNFNQALALNQLAMDLARSKSIDLSTATQLVEQVMAGNTRVMKEYGISLDSATTSAQALDILQQQVGGSAEAAADTAAGHWREVQAQWQAIEQEVGNQLMPALDQLFDAFEQNLPEIEELLNGVVLVIKGVVDGLSAVLDVANVLAAPFRIVGDAIGNVINVSQGLGWQQLSLSEAFTGSNGKASALTSTMGKLASSTKTTGANFDDITNRIKGADTAVIKHADAVAKLGDEYDKLHDTGIADLTDLTGTFQSKLADINKSIGDTMLKIGDLSDSYVKTQQDDTAKVADTIVASEQKISDLKVQIGQATSAAQASDLDQQLNKEQLGYASSIAFASAHADAIAAARARFNETDLQRTVDDYNKKQALDTADYQKKLTALQQELIDKRKEADDETTLYQAKVKSIAKILDESQAYFQKLSAERVDMTTKEVDAEVQQFQRLTTAIGGIKSATALSLPSFGALPHFATGGIVSSPTIGLIGEAGPEAIIPLSAFAGCMSLAGSGGAGAGGITINITGNTISNKLDLRNLAQEVGDEIVRTLRMNQRVAV